MIVLRCLGSDGLSAFVKKPAAHAGCKAGDVLVGSAYCWPQSMSHRDRLFFKTFLHKTKALPWAAIYVDEVHPTNGKGVGAIFERGIVLAVGSLDEVKEVAAPHDIVAMLNKGKIKRAARRLSRKQHA